MAPRRALGIVAHILRGLEHLHGHGLIHRDVKPSNILFIGGQPKLGDVGLVTSMDHTLTIVGTPGYMPPDGAIDQSADLYAVGVMFYEMLTGLHRSKFPELPANLASRTCPTRADRRTLTHAIHIANKAANWNRQQRYRSAEEFHASIRTKPPLFGSIRWRTRLAITALIAVACVGIGYLGAARRGPAIVSAAVDSEDNQLLTLTYASGDRPQLRLSFNATRPVLVDLDGNERHFVALGTAQSDPPRLLVLDPDQDLPVMEQRPALTVDFTTTKPPYWHQVFNRGASVMAWHVGDLVGEMAEELAVTLNYDQGPCGIFIFQRKREPVFQFWHYGNIGQVHVADLDGDDVKELVVSGMANARKDDAKFEGRDENLHLAIMVLDPRATGGPQAHWCMNPWMNEGSNPQLSINSSHRPVAYGYFRLGAPAGPGPKPFLADRLEIRPNDRNGPIRVHLNCGRHFDLTGDLRPATSEFRGEVLQEHQGVVTEQLTGLPSKFWARNWPPE